MKRVLLLTLSILILFLAACKDDEPDMGEATLDTVHFDEFVYASENITIGDTTIT